MTKINDGGPAFPPMAPLESWGDPHQGMTLRDYFAGQALAGLAPSIDRMSYAPETFESAIAVRCYDLADAMLKAREAQP